MQYLSDYKLECDANSNRKRFDAITNLSMLMKIAALLVLIGMLWYFWILYVAIAVWVSSMVLNYQKRRLAYRFIYLYSSGELSIFQEFQDKKREFLVNINLNQVSECRKVEKTEICEGIPLYLDENALCDHIIYLKAGDLQFYMIADDYFYSIIMRECK